MANEAERLKIVRMVSQMERGPEMDAMIATFVFDEELEQCSIHAAGHLRGASHYVSKTDGENLCSGVLPPFSGKRHDMVIDWLAGSFLGLDIYKDVDTWYCNVNDRDSTGQWYRIVHTPGSRTMSAAVCKAALFTKLQPLREPIEIRTRIDTSPKKRAKRRKK